MCGTMNNRDSVSNKKVEGEDRHSVLSSDCQHIIYMPQTHKKYTDTTPHIKIKKKELMLIAQRHLYFLSIFHDVHTVRTLPNDTVFRIHPSCYMMHECPVSLLPSLTNEA